MNWYQLKEKKRREKNKKYSSNKKRTDKAIYEEFFILLGCVFCVC